MRRAIGFVLGALGGVAFTTFGLVGTSDGLHIGGGNEATLTVVAVGVGVGALLGVTLLWRWPTAVLGAIIGLAAAVWLRDNATLHPVQPPWVFFLLFGLPLVGAVGGYLLQVSIDRHRSASV